MVHALEECWRVLVPDGQLIDIRPRATNPNVELVLNKSVRIAGQLDDSAGEIDYEAADRAMATLVSRGRFAKQGERRFAFAYYWQTPGQMQDFIDETWSGYVVLSPQVVQRAVALSPEGQPVQYRVRETIVIADYRRQTPV
jgi:hypothetical protein